MNRMLKIIVTGSFAFVMMGCGDGAGGGGGTCQRQYTTADLAGCYQSVNSASEWLCFDGQGQWGKKMWTQISGCATIENGTYEINGCTMKSCSQKSGCGTYPVGQDQEGNPVINGVTYKESDC